MESLLPEQIQNLRTVFDAYDHNKDGLLDVNEVSAVFQSFGVTLSEAEVPPAQ